MDRVGKGRRGAHPAQGWDRIGKTLLLVGLLAVVAQGCHHTVELRYEQLEELNALGEGAQVELSIDGEPLVVTPAMSPELVIYRSPPCSLARTLSNRQECSGEVRGAPVRLEFEEEGVRVRLTPALPWLPNEYFVVREHIQVITLNYDPPDRRPSFGLGVALLGPSRFGGIQALWIPTRWLALDGGLAALAHVGGTAWTGARLRPIAIGDVRPFVGAFYALLTYQPSGDDPENPPDRPRDITHGARIGIDIEVDPHAVLTLELDYFLDRSAPEAEILYERGMQRFLSGGFSLTYLF